MKILIYTAISGTDNLSLNRYPSIEIKFKSLKSRIVYQIFCARCQECYVGQTDRHLLKRFKEHCQPSQPFGKHIRLCGTSPVFEDKTNVSVIHTTNRCIPFLETFRLNYGLMCQLSYHMCHRLKHFGLT